MANPHAPYHPIIYVRGFAGTQSEIEATVADPFMGFNIGSTKSRRIWDGTMRRYFFESPLVRLKDEIIWKRTATGRERSDQWYDDVYVNGEDLTAPDADDKTKPLRSDITLPYQSIAILRYYDDASSEFGDGQPHPITHFAQNLGELILRMRTLVCRKNGKHPILGDPLDNGVEEKDFKVYLVAHSMGGLVCRAFLQNDTLGAQEARDAVDKLFTYATPHNGIDLRVVRNVPGWGALGEATNFNRDTMKSYLRLAPTATDVSELTQFPPERVFNLVGSNPADYLALQGLSSWAVGEASDGLVRMDNATTFGMVGPEGGPRLRVDSPRAFVFRSHSGHYGIVNSEEGYQNLTRFLFGSVRTDGIWTLKTSPCPKRWRRREKTAMRSAPPTASRSSRPCAEASGSCTAGWCARTPRSSESSTNSFSIKAPASRARRTRRRARTCSRSSSIQPGPAPTWAIRSRSHSTSTCWCPTMKSTACCG